MKVSVCVDALYNGKNFTKSITELAKNNIREIEFWAWWDKNIDDIIKVQQEKDIKIIAFCTKFISLTDENKRDDFISGLKESIEIAKKIGCNTLIAQVGEELKNIPRKKQHLSIVNGLKACVPILEKANIRLVFEPLNTLVDHKGYYLYSSAEAFSIVEEVNSENVKVLYDIYHQQIMEGNIIETIKKNIDKIGHFHGAGIPNRHELNSGELNYINIFNVIDKLEYNGYIGLEYFPVESPLKGIKDIIDAK